MFDREVVDRSEASGLGTWFEDHLADLLDADRTSRPRRARCGALGIGANEKGQYTDLCDPWRRQCSSARRDLGFPVLEAAKSHVPNTTPPPVALVTTPSIVAPG
jgi:hypothetical protein